MALRYEQNQQQPVLRKMTIDDIPEVMEIEHEAFTLPGQKKHFVMN